MTTEAEPVSTGHPLEAVVCSPALAGLIEYLEEEARKWGMRPQNPDEWTDGWIHGNHNAYKDAAKKARKCQENLPVSHAGEQ